MNLPFYPWSGNQRFQGSAKNLTGRRNCAECDWSWEGIWASGEAVSPPTGPVLSCIWVALASPKSTMDPVKLEYPLPMHTRNTTSCLPNTVLHLQITRVLTGNYSITFYHYEFVSESAHYIYVEAPKHFTKLLRGKCHLFEFLKRKSSPIPPSSISS